MRGFKRFLTCFFVTLAIIALAGCGVSKEDHEKTVAELSKTKADLAQANSKTAELEKSLGLAQAQAKSETSDLRAKVESLTSENANLQSTLEKLKTEYAEIQKKIEGMQKPSKSSPAGLPKKP
jgi:peptidoglycan hydrolase CwlO-like protein